MKVPCHKSCKEAIPVLKWKALSRKRSPTFWHLVWSTQCRESLDPGSAWKGFGETDEAKLLSMNCCPHGSMLGSELHDELYLMFKLGQSKYAPNVLIRDKEGSNITMCSC